jgi:cytochrome c-type biogenesis protein CcmH
MRAALAAALIALMLHAVASVQAQSREATPMAADPVIEARVMSLANELRCLVCQNQTIADSNAALAVDLRNQVRDQVKAGRSNAQIIDYLVARYGDFVLYRPPVKLTTVLLWVGPFVLLLAGLTGLAVTLRRRARVAAAQGAAAGSGGADVDQTRARAKALLDAGGRDKDGA